MKKVFLAALLASVASTAFAADLPTRKAPPAPAPYYTAPAFTWTGFYIGVNGGYGWADPSSSNFANASGGLVGGQIGYNYQVGMFVGGVEADLDYTDFSSNNTYNTGLSTNSFRTNWMTTERLRAGIAFDRALIFVTGGYAGIDVKGSYFNTFTGVGGSQDSWRSGGVIGGGVEYAFTNNISAKVEYLYAPISNQTYFAGAGAPDAERSSLGVSTIRGGLNFKF